VKSAKGTSRQLQDKISYPDVPGRLTWLLSPSSQSRSRLDANNERPGTTGDRARNRLSLGRSTIGTDRTGDGAGRLGRRGDRDLDLGRCWARKGDRDLGRCWARKGDRDLDRRNREIGDLGGLGEGKVEGDSSNGPMSTSRSAPLSLLGNNGRRRGTADLLSPRLLRSRGPPRS